MMKSLSLLILFQFILIASSFAQHDGVTRTTAGATHVWDGKISGKIIENDSRAPIEFASIGLYHSGIEVPMDGTVTDEQGSFKFKNLKPGMYMVEVTFLGFETKTIDSLNVTEKKTSVSVGTVLLSPKNRVLNEATVEGEKNLVEMKIDKLVYNASKDLTSKGGNAGDVLRKVPMVTVDLDGHVMLQGTQNVKILINNKPSSILAGSLDVALKLIPADQIDRVEVITSPSAKYDAEGTGGIINIITKKKNMAGTNGSVNIGAGTRSSNLNGDINYRSGRFGSGLSVGGFGYHGKGDLTTTRITTDSSGTNNLLEKGKNSLSGTGPYIGWTTDLDITSKNTISTSLQYYGFYQNINSSTSNYYNNENQFNASNKTSHDELGYDALLEYRRVFENQDRDWTVTLQHSNNTEVTDYDVERIYMQPVPGSILESSRNDNVNRETTLQTDLTNPFSKKFTLETGAKALIRNVTSDSKKDFTFPTWGFPESNVVSTFNYDQNIYAAYAVGALSLKKFGCKVGARFEQTELKGDQDSDSTKFTGNYNNVIPSVAVSFKEDKYQFKLSYTQRIQRPSANFLNPYRNSVDAYNITYGNPRLGAETSHAFELGYSLFKEKASFMITAFHRFTNNAIEQYSIVNGPLYETTYDNIGENSSDGVNVGGNVRHRGLSVSVNTNVFYYEVKSTHPEIKAHNSAINYDINLFSTLKINDRWKLQAFGSFNGPRYSVQGYTTSFFYYNVSGYREFKNGKGGLGFGLDNFATPYIHFKGKYEGPDFSYTTDNKIFFPGIRLNFDYRFGHMDFGSKRKKKIRNDDLKQGENTGFGGGGGEEK
ncbi:MAG: TonB-dependent receptor [Bacteroidota bacterium]